MAEKHKFAKLFIDNAGVSLNENEYTFSGTAYSGDVIPDAGWWENLVIDLDTLQMSEKPLPALVNHDYDRYAGYGTLSVEGGALKFSGKLLKDNPHAEEVRNASVQGFPWQMSVFVIPDSIDFVERGTVEVNGRTFNAPVTIFRNSRIREVSFTPVGADPNTEALAASAAENVKPTQKEKPTMSDTNEAMAKELEELRAKLKAAEEELAELRFAAAKHEVAAKAEELGVELTDEEVEAMAKLEASAREAALNSLERVMAKFSANPKPVTPESGQGDTPKNLADFMGIGK